MMSLVKKLTLPSLVLIAILAVYLRNSSDSSPSLATETASPHEQASPSPLSIASPLSLTPNTSSIVVTVTPASSPSPAATTATVPMALPKLPTVAKLRKAVRRNPHETPEALLRFGAELGARMNQAKTNEKDAAVLLDELKGCANPEKLDQSPLQTRAICLITAHELGQIWPNLKEKADDIVTHSDQTARDLATKVKRFE
jgi:hypothetical protein